MLSLTALLDWNPAKLRGVQSGGIRTRPQIEARHRRPSMPAEYTGAMGDTSFDQDVTRIAAGDAQSLRERLTAALERLGYRVLNENPIRARRGASGLARSG